MSHTEGKLVVYNAMRIRDERGLSVATTAISQKSDETSAANTRRLVACWNACKGIPTDSLEADIGLMDLFNHFSQDAHAMRCARDYEVAENRELRYQMMEALEALSMAMQWIDSVPSNTQLPAMPGFDRDHVDAILAKHQKGNDHGQE